MEDVYTIKVKTKPDTRNLYPSERRYSASTVSGLAWVHIALSATSFLLALLALVNPESEVSGNNRTESIEPYNLTDPIYDGNITDTNNGVYILVLSPSLLSIFALAAGVASILASVRWYIDRNITWLFVMSVLSTICAFASFVMVIVWLSTSAEDLTAFYKDKEPFQDFIVVKHTDVMDRNESHMIISLNPNKQDHRTHSMFSKRVLSINILIAAFLELLWSILSVKISYKGMRSNYKDNEQERRGNCISVVTTIKGNNAKNFKRNGKIMPPKPDLIEHYPNKKIKLFLTQDNDYYMKEQNNKTKHNTETSSEFYKERMLSFLNRCASLEGMSNPELMRTPSVQSENALNPIPEVANVEINTQPEPQSAIRDEMTHISWGDTPEHTVYNQNTLNLEKIFNFNANKLDNGVNKPTDTEIYAHPNDDININVNKEN